MCVYILPKISKEKKILKNHPTLFHMCAKCIVYKVDLASCYATATAAPYTKILY